MKVNCWSAAIMEGLIYPPSREATSNCTLSLNADQLTMVINSLVLLGSTDWKAELFESYAIQAPGSCAGGGTSKQA